jgi:hypothetical protein
MPRVLVAEDLAVRGATDAAAPIHEGGLLVGILAEGDLALAPAGVEHHPLEALLRR